MLSNTKRTILILAITLFSLFLLYFLIQRYVTTTFSNKSIVSDVLLEETISNFNLDNIQVDPILLFNTCASGKDCMKAIDHPKFESISNANNWLKNNDIVLGVNYDGIQKAYPLRIVKSYLIVNDVFNSTPIVTTYCESCNVGTSFISIYKDTPLSFGVSGLGYDLDQLMYDKGTNSLWSQTSGMALSGEYSKKHIKLKMVSITTTSWGKWKDKYPNTVVLSNNINPIQNQY